MADAEDVYGAVLQREQDTVIPEPEPVRAGHITMQRIHVAGAGAGEMQHALEDAHGAGAVESADIGTGLIEPLDPIGWHLPGVFRREREIFRLCAELSEDILHGNADALRKTGPTIVKPAAVLLRYSFIVGRGRGQGAGDGIDHHLEQMTDGGELALVELIEQMVGMLLVHCSSLIANWRPRYRPSADSAANHAAARPMVRPASGTSLWRCHDVYLFAFRHASHAADEDRARRIHANYT